MRLLLNYPALLTWTTSPPLQLNFKPLPQPLPKIIKQRRTRTQRQTHKRKNTNPPSIPQLLKQARRKQRDHSPDQTPEHRSCRNSRGGVLGKGINIVVLHGIKDGNLPEREENVAEDCREPVDAVLDAPRKPEEPEGDEHGADVRERETEFRERVAVVPRCELVIHGIDSGYDEEDSDEESGAEAEVHEPDTGGRIAIAIFAPDIFEVGVKAVIRTKEDSLIHSHRKNNRLGKQYPQGPQHRMKQFRAERAVVFAFKVGD